MVVTQANFRWLSLGFRTVRGPGDHGQGVPPPLHRLVLPPADVRDGQRARDRAAQGLLDAGVPLRYASELTDLLLEDDRVAGDRVQRATAAEHWSGPPGASSSAAAGSSSTSRCARSTSLPDLHRADDRRASSTPATASLAGIAAGAERPSSTTPGGADDPAPPRSVVLPAPSATCPARLWSTGRQAVHERGPPVRRGGARDLRGRGHRRLPRAGLAGDRPALPQPLPVRRPRRRGSRSPAVGTSAARSSRPPRSRRWPRDRRPGRRARGDRRAVQRLRRSQATTRTSTAARAPTTGTTPTPGQAEPVAAQHRPGAVLRRQDRPRRPRHQGRDRHRRARTGAARRTAR